MTTPRPVTITARLGSAWIPGRGGDMLDGPLSWAYASRATGRGIRLRPLLGTQPPPDFPLPLDRWEEGEAWGWCVSRAIPDVVAHTAVQVRRKPAVQAMARYAPDRKHHSGLGPMKARDTTLSAVIAGSVSWHALSVDDGELLDLLGHITHLGARHRNGHGQVIDWTITDGPDEGWRDRPMPNPDGHRLMRTRAPYWHHHERTPCDG